MGWRMYCIDIAKCAERYNAGATLTYLAKDADISVATMHRYLVAHGVSMRPSASQPGAKKNMPKVLAQRLEDIRRFAPLKWGDRAHLADKWGISREAARRFIRRHEGQI